MRLPAFVLVLALLAAGCTRTAEDPPPSTTPPAPSASAPAFELFTPARLAEAPLATSVEPRWVRPGERIEASAPGGERADWFLASRNPIRTDAPPPLEARAQPGSTASLALAQAGRHLFSVGGAGFAASIVPELGPTTLLVVATHDGEGWRVAPQAARGGVGSRLVIDDRGPSDLLVERRDVERLVATGSAVTFAMPEGLEMGDYDVVASVVDEERALSNASRVVYDRRKPDAAWEAGPFTGAFQSAAGAQPTRHEWKALHDARDVTVGFSLSSSAPLPASARVELVDANGTVVAGGGVGGFALAHVPKGPYAFLVTAEEGVLLEYEVSARGEWVLVPPASFFNT